MRRGGLRNRELNKGWVSAGESRPYVHLAVDCWINYDTLTRGIALGCQPVICGTSVDKQALVGCSGVHVYPSSGMDRVSMQVDVGRRGTMWRQEETTGGSSLMRRERNGHEKRKY